MIRLIIVKSALSNNILHAPSNILILRHWDSNLTKSFHFYKNEIISSSLSPRSSKLRYFEGTCSIPFDRADLTLQVSKDVLLLRGDSRVVEA